MPWVPPSNPSCAKCKKTVYVTEKLDCLDQVWEAGLYNIFTDPSGYSPRNDRTPQIWHQACFTCTVCQLKLTMNTYKGFDRQPYCKTCVWGRGRFCCCCFS
jgi:hypothetical protein